MGVGFNWCHKCNGHGHTGWFWWRKVCPECKADKRYEVRSRAGWVVGYLQPPPPGGPPKVRA